VLGQYPSARGPAGVPRRAALRLGLGTLGVLGFGASSVAFAEVIAPSTGTPPGPAGATPAGPALNVVQAQRRLDGLVNAAGGRMSVAAFDRVSQVRLSSGSRRFATASIIKVDILAALLLQRSKQGASLTAGEKSLAKSMVTVSDNDAASRLFETIGGVQGLKAANQTLGLRETVPVPAWGETTTTAADQIRLLLTLTGEQSPLPKPARQLVLDLMGDVVDDQAWGVTAAAGTQASGVWVKNGWLPIGGQWLVNSIGRVAEPSHDWLIAVLSDDHSSMDKGIAAVESAARLTLGELRKSGA
jgi:beta-lactamase class A